MTTLTKYNQPMRLSLAIPSNTTEYTVTFVAYKSGRWAWEPFYGNSTARVIDVQPIVLPYMKTWMEKYRNMTSADNFQNFLTRPAGTRIFFWVAGANTEKEDYTCPDFTGNVTSAYVNVALTQTDALNGVYTTIIKLSTSSTAGLFIARGSFLYVVGNGFDYNVFFIWSNQNASRYIELKRNNLVARVNNLSFLPVGNYASDDYKCNILLGFKDGDAEDLLPQFPVLPNNSYQVNAGLQAGGSMYFQNLIFSYNFGDGRVCSYLNSYDQGDRTAEVTYFFVGLYSLYTGWQQEDIKCTKFEVLYQKDVTFTIGANKDPVYTGESFNIAYNSYIFDGFVPCFVGGTSKIRFAPALEYRQITFMNIIQSQQDNTKWGVIVFHIEFNLPISYAIEGETGLTIWGDYYRIECDQPFTSYKLYNVIQNPCARYYLKWETSCFVDDCYPFECVCTETRNTTNNTYEDAEGLQVYSTETQRQWKLNSDWIKPNLARRFGEIFTSSKIELLDTKTGEIVPVYIENPTYQMKTLQNNNNRGFNVQVTVTSKKKSQL